MRRMTGAPLVVALLACGGGDGPASDAGGSTSSGGSESAGPTTDASTSTTGSGSATAGTSSTGSSAGTSSDETTDGGTGGTTGGPAFSCQDDCLYVRADAAGAGDGSDWENAFTDLPADLLRGSVYLVADGDYGTQVIDDAAAGADLITVRKATEDEHGTDVGWQAGMGDGRARFGPVQITGPYVVFDGVVDEGFEVVGAFEGAVVQLEGDEGVLRNVDINGAFVLSNGQHTDGACTGLDVGGSNTTVEHSRIHDVADDGVSMAGVTNVRFAHNTVHSLHACGTDGGCGPCYNGHSDGIELYDVEQSELDGNLVYDVRSTATLFLGNWADSLGNGPSEYCQDLRIVNNIFYAPEVGLVAYLQDLNGAQVHNNVFWGVRQGSYGGLSVGPNVTGLYLYNNIILSVNTAHTGSAYDAAEHHSDYNLFGHSTGQWVESANDQVVADPLFVSIPDVDGAPVADPTPDQFALQAGSPAVGAGFGGDATVMPPVVDFFGDPRGTPPDQGAVESP